MFLNGLIKPLYIFVRKLPEGKKNKLMFGGLPAGKYVIIRSVTLTSRKAGGRICRRRWESRDLADKEKLFVNCKISGCKNACQLVKWG